MPDKDPTLMARCPECDSRIYFERRPDNGQIIVCPECENSLEVIRTNPIRLDWAYEEGDRPSASNTPPDDFFADLDSGERDLEDMGEDEDYSRY